jgi:hypothetical protein
MGPVSNDNPSAIPFGGPIAFPNTAVNNGLDVTRNVAGTVFTLVTAGTYSVYFDVSITDTAQLALFLNSTVLGYTMVGRDAGTTQIVGMFLISTIASNQLLSVVNQHAAAITVTVNAGGGNPVSAHLIITRVA